MSGRAAAWLAWSLVVLSVVLLVILVLNVYKPRGMTRYGWRKQDEQRRASQRNKQDEQRTVPQP